MKTVTIQKTLGSEPDKVYEFANAKEARNFFYEWCDEHGIDYEPNAIEAGGIGHDYRITITETEVLSEE